VKSIHNKLNRFFPRTLDTYWVNLLSKLDKRFGVIPDAGKWEMYDEVWERLRFRIYWGDWV
jgi:hypothetical protein